MFCNRECVALRKEEPRVKDLILSLQSVVAKLMICLKDVVVRFEGSKKHDCNLYTNIQRY